jgi:DNA polymerase-1
MNKYAELLSNINNNNVQREVTDSILIVDALNLFLRSFTMINHINPDGHHIGGLTGSLKSLGYAIKLIEPTKVVLVFDGVGGSNNKRNLYPEYKANRNKSRITNYSIFNDKEEEKESINNQIERFIQYLQLLPVSIICVDGIEADDVIGYLVGKFENHNSTKEVTIMSADGDFLQLTSNKTQVYSPTKKKIYKPKDVLEEYKVSNINFIYYKILMGDISDNLPGIKGLGPKKILKMFPQLSSEMPFTLDDILLESNVKINDHILYSKIVEQKNQLDINRQLMDLKSIPLSDGNKDHIKKSFNTSYNLDKHTFMSLYFNDKLGESIPNTSNWLNQVFGYLNSFN